MIANRRVTRGFLYESTRGRRAQRGFSLIELGIVVAVIAVLAAVVLVGRGFLNSARVSKVTEGIGVTKKAAATVAGLQGGRFPVTSTGNELGGLSQRQLVPALTNSVWQLQGAEFAITDVRFQSAGDRNCVAVTYTVPAGFLADSFKQLQTDPNFMASCAGTQVGGLTCATSAPTSGTSAIACFAL
jgi:prepilin-type N-terminal cleavage/methylation domain-containing protein